MIERLKSKIITKELAKLDLISGICGTAICNRNGLIITSRIPRHIDDRKFGAMAATMFEAIGTAITSFEDKVVNLTVEYDEEQLVIFAINRELIFITLLKLNIDLGIVLIELEEIVKFIQHFLEVE